MEVVAAAVKVLSARRPSNSAAARLPLVIAALIVITFRIFRRLTAKGDLTIARSRTICGASASKLAKARCAVSAEGKRL